MIKKYFVIGNPIDHSLSPKIHNYWFKKNNIDATYDKIKLEDHEVKNFIQDIKAQKVAGCNVTVPFKKTVMPFLDKLSSEAEKTQSVNTISFNNGDLIGHNTDIAGFDTAIKKLNFTVKGKKVLILGAGGVVPSIILALKNKAISEIILSNRTKEKADDLKKSFPFLKVIDWGETIKSDLIINATSIGIKQNDEIKLDYTKLDGQLFYDVIYNPPKTKFLENAKKSGKKTENGKNMFIYQAMKAFQTWHGIKPEINDEVRDLIK